MGMTPDQRRRPETIYRLNCELEDLRRLRLDKHLDVHLQPTLYSRRKRNFHWLAVHPKSWRDTTATFWEQLGVHVEKARGYVDTYAGNPENLNKRKIQHSAQVLRDFIDKRPRHSKAVVLDAVLQFYSTYPLDPDWFVDGILRRQVGASRLRGDDRRLAMVEGTLEQSSDSTWRLTNTSGWQSGVRQRRIDLGTEKQLGQAEPWLVGILEVLMRLEKERPTRVLVVPIYDHPPEYGGMLLGSLHVLTRDAGVDLKSAVGDTPLVNSGRLARALYSSAISLVASDAITLAGEFVPTLIQHGAQEMARLHDWEQIVVFQGSELRWKWCRRGTHTGELVFCDVEGRNAHGPACEHDRPALPTLKDDPRWLLGQDLRWLADFHVANQLSEAEIKEFSNYTFGFKFPDYVILAPGDHSERSPVAIRYWRDRNDVWNILIPKVRAHVEQRRATEARDKLATVAIVGRNMSHNIGSHILSKLSDLGEVKKHPVEAAFKAVSKLMVTDPDSPEAAGRLRFVLEKSLTRSSEDISTLNAYLRDRMDLIADLATTDPSWSMTLPLKDVIRGFTKQNLVRKWLTSGAADVVFAADAAIDARIEIPHGVVGMQALYLILENILRNSHRHGKGPDRGRLLIHTLPESTSPDCLVVDILDRGSSAVKLGKIKRDLAREFYEDGVLSKQAWGLKEVKIGAAFLRQRPAHRANNAADMEGTAGYPSTKGAEWVEVHRRDGCLAWRLRLLRPKRAFLICEALPAMPESLERDGVSVRGPDSLGDLLASASRAFPMLVCIGEKANDYLDSFLKTSNRHRLPLRLLTDRPRSDGIVSHAVLSRSDTSHLNDLVASGAADTIEQFLWHCWIAQLSHWAGFRSKLVICDKNLAWSQSSLVKPEDYLIASENNGADEVVYQRHLADLAKDKAFRRRRVQFRCLIPYDGNSELLSVITSVVAGSSSVLEGRLLETGLISVVMFDERLSAWRKEKENRTAATRWGYSQVLVQDFVNDKEVRYSEVNVDAVASLLDGATPGLLVVSIHKNLLDGVVNGRATDGTPGLVDEWAQAIRHLLPGRVVVTVHSGRGRVGSEFLLPFVEYSNIERFVRDAPNKFYLANLMMALREN